MAELRFASAPPKRKPNRALLAAGLVVLLAAAFGVGRLWTRPPAAQTATPSPTAAPPERPSPLPAAAPTTPPRAAPTMAVAPAQTTLLTSSEVFTIPRTRAPATPAELSAAPSAVPIEKLAARCLSFTVSRDSMFTVTSGVRLLIKARNRCSQTIPGSEARFEVRAMASNGSGLAGRERGSFQTSIQPFESAETVIVVPCDPDASYRFEVEVM